MISRSIYLCCKKELLESVFGELGIASVNISNYERGASYLETKENGALVEQVHGDFNYVVDFDLFDRDLHAVMLAFEKLSRHSIEFAMPVEEDDDPYVFHLWRDGKKLLIRVCEDEYDEDKILILDTLGDAGLQ